MLCTCLYTATHTKFANQLAYNRVHRKSASPLRATVFHGAAAIASRRRDERAAADWKVRQARPMGCCSFEPSDIEPETSADNNVQIAQLISALGGSNAGRRAILQAVAERQGIENPDVIEEMMHGDSDQRLEVPLGSRDAFRSTGKTHLKKVLRRAQPLAVF